MKLLTTAALAAIIILTGCTSANPQPQDSPLKLPRCMEYTSKWKGKGTPRELQILENMNNKGLKLSPDSGSRR